ncbi:MAG TPA: hypothetical protein VFX16_03230 [Pseudonocardiaceae bacterium]|nr:hypothetical protein [Pseudonocardiaceae bacterium]
MYVPIAVGQGELSLQPGEVRCDQLVARAGALGGQDGFHVRRGHVQIAQSPDHLCDRDLVERVVADGKVTSLITLCNRPAITDGVT